MNFGTATPGHHGAHPYDQSPPIQRGPPPVIPPNQSILGSANRQMAPPPPPPQGHPASTSFLLPQTQQVREGKALTNTRQWQNYDIRPPQSDTANYDKIIHEYNVRQDENLREHQERNRVIENLERTLEDERHKAQQVRLALQQDNEKEKRLNIDFENQIKNLREDAYRKDEAMNEMQKQIAHLKEESYRLDDFNKQQAQQLFAVKEDLNQVQRQYDEDMKRAKRYQVSQDERYRQEVERLNMENQTSVESLNKQWDYKYKALEEKCKNLLAVKAGIEQELRAMDEEMVKERMQHEERLREKVVTVQEEEQRKFQSSMRSQEQKLASVTQSFNNMIEKNKELISELSEREKTLREQSLVLEQINNNHTSEQAELKNQITQLTMYRESLQKDLNEKENVYRRTEAELLELKRNIQAMRDDQTREVTGIEEANRVEKTRLEAIRDKQARKIGEQEKTMAQMEDEIEKLRDEKNRLKDMLQDKIKSTIDNTVNDEKKYMNNPEYTGGRPQHALKY